MHNFSIRGKSVKLVRGELGGRSFIRRWMIGLRACESLSLDSELEGGLWRRIEGIIGIRGDRE